MIGLALALCFAALVYAIYCLLIVDDIREMRLRRRLSIPPNREAWLRQQERFRKELDR